MTAQESSTSHEVRLNDDGSVDEVLISDVDFVHVEQMGSDHWWIGIDARGVLLHLNFHAAGPIRLWVEDEGDMIDTVRQGGQVVPLGPEGTYGGRHWGSVEVMEP